MAQTIGQLLQKEREQRGLTIADVAHDTRIHADTIRGLEADDYSVFSSTTYARSFLQLYSRHLEVNAEEALHDFDSVSENLSSGKFSYLESVNNAIEPGETIHPHENISQRVPYGETRKQPFPLFLAIVVFLLLLIIPVFYLIGKKAESLEEAGAIFKDAISSNKENPLTQANQVESKDKSGLEEGLAITENKSTPSSDSDKSSEKDPRKHRFPTRLPDEKLNPVKLEAARNLKAVPIIPGDSSPGKTDTAQN